MKNATLDTGTSLKQILLWGEFVPCVFSILRLIKQGYFFLGHPVCDSRLTIGDKRLCFFHSIKDV